MKTFPFDDEGAVLELVAHFLGIATHDNINAPPSCLAAQGRDGDAGSLAIAVADEDGMGLAPSPLRHDPLREPSARGAGLGAAR